MRILRHAELACLRLAQALAIIGLGAVICFAAATVVDGLARSLFGAPIVVVGDAGSFLVAAAMSACFPLAQLQHANISIELAGAVAGRRTEQVLRTGAAWLVFIVLVAMTRQMFSYAGDAESGGDTTVMLGIGTAPFWYIVAVMFAAAGLTQLLVAIVESARCSGRGES